MYGIRVRNRQLSKHPNIFYPWQVEQLIGLGRGTLYHWNSSGLYQPRVPRLSLRYDLVDMCVLSCFVMLKKHGVSTRKLRARYSYSISSSLLSRIDEGAQLEELQFAFTLSGHAWIGPKADKAPADSVEIIDFAELKEQLLESKKLLVQFGTPTKKL